MGLCVRDQDKALNLTFTNLDSSNLADLKLLNQIIFPVKYSDRFYTECRKAGSVTQLAFSGPKLVGAIACRLEAQSNGLAKLYIMTLGVRAPYRGQGIGSQLLQRSLSLCEEDANVMEAYLHVQISNREAIDFYTRRFGFREAEVLQNYYKRIDPPHAVVLRREFRKARVNN